MSEESNWRPVVNAQDYLGAQKKRAAMQERRHSPRSLADLAGPGIVPHAARLADFNDERALFNGFYSAAPGTPNAPNGTDAFVGTVSSDALLGGVQMFTALATGVTYRRTFLRNVLDPSWITWPTAWAEV